MVVAEVVEGDVEDTVVVVAFVVDDDEVAMVVVHPLIGALTHVTVLLDREQLSVVHGLPSSQFAVCVIQSPEMTLHPKFCTHWFSEIGH